MATEQKIEARDTVGLVLMGSEEADVAVEMLREEHPDLRITKTNCYWMIEGEGKIEVDVTAVGERLGRAVGDHHRRATAAPVDRRRRE